MSGVRRRRSPAQCISATERPAPPAARPGSGPGEPRAAHPRATRARTAGSANSSPGVVEQRTDRGVVAGDIGIVAGPDVQRRRHRPAGVVGPVGLARDVRLDRGQPVVVERERRVDVRADHALRLLVEPVDQRVGVASPSLATVSRSTHACSAPVEAPRPSDGFVHAQASPTATRPVTTGRPSTTNARRRSARPPKTAMSVIGSRTASARRPGGAASAASQLRGPAQRPQRAVTGAGDDAQPVGAVVGGQRQQRDRAVVGEVRCRGPRASGRAAAVVAGVVAEPAVGRGLGRCAPARRDDPVDGRAVPPGRVDDEVGGSSPPSVRTPTTRGTAATCPTGGARPTRAPAVTRPDTRTPRRIVRPGVRAATPATAASMTGLRAVTAVKRWSPGRHPPVTRRTAGAACPSARRRRRAWRRAPRAAPPP